VCVDRLSRPEESSRGDDLVWKTAGEEKKAFFGLARDCLLACCGRGRLFPKQRQAFSGAFELDLDVGRVYSCRSSCPANERLGLSISLWG
jgi:hypothetical protein